MLMIISIFTLPFLSMGIGGHALLVFVTILRTHLFLTKFHTYLLISPKTAVAVSSNNMTGVNFLF